MSCWCGMESYVVCVCGCGRGVWFPSVYGNGGMHGCVRGIGEYGEEEL